MNKLNLNESSLLFANAVLKAFTMESKKVYRFLFWILIGLIAIFSALKLYGGLSPIWAPWDVFIQINGGWRIFNRQIPYIDYYDPIGPLTYIPTALGMMIGKPSASAIVYGNVVFGIMMTLWSWFIARNRLSSLNAFLFSSFIFILTISTRPLGYGITHTTYAMLYNRYGYVLYSLLLVQLFILPARELINTKIFEGLSVGILLALLLYCKVTYFLVGIVAVILYLVIFKPSRIWLATVLAGFLLVLVGMFVFFQVNPSAYISNIITAGASQSLSGRLKNLAQALKNDSFLIYLTGLPLLFLSIINNDVQITKTASTELLKLWAIVILIIASGLLLTSSNASEGNELPVFFVCGLMMFRFLNQHSNNSNESRISNKSIVMLLLLFIMVPVFWGYTISKDILSILYTANWNRKQLASISPSQRFQSDSLYDFVIPGNSDWTTAYWVARDMPGRVNEGLDLLQRHIHSNNRFFCLCFTDPFSFGLRISPVLNTPLWWDENYSFNAKVYPQPETFLQAVDFVIEPVFTEDDIGCCKETVSLMKSLYGGYLKENFSKIDSSAHWLLLKRNQ